MRFIAAFTLLLLVVSSAHAKNNIKRRGAEIIVIDKLTAQHHPYTLSAGGAISHEKIAVKLLKCVKEKTNILPEHAALVESIRINEGRGTMLYKGWLFKEKSDITNLQHPAYDVQLLGCTKAE